MRLLRSFGDDPQEPDDLEHMVSAKIASVLEAFAGTTRLSSRADYAAFAKYRFGHHLRNYRQFGGLYAFAFTALSVIAIASGAASAAIAAGWGDTDSAQEIIVGLGLSAAISAAVNQLWRPAQKAASRFRGGNALAYEGWAFLLNRGRYATLGGPEAVEAFVDEVNAILKETAIVDESVAEGAPPGHAPGR